MDAVPPDRPFDELRPHQAGGLLIGNVLRFPLARQLPSGVSIGRAYSLHVSV
jgi:hypothetical protein